MADQVEWVNLTIWRADAIVLYDWLMETDLNAVPITHRAQKQALMDLLTSLEACCIRGIAGHERSHQAF
jgi:hypothetical protein